MQRIHRFVLLLMLLVAPAAMGADRPNVLFIAVDDLKPAIGAFGDDYAITPNMDRLAEMGTIFTNAHCQQAVCGPSRVSILLGRRPDATRVWKNQDKFRDHLPDAVTLPQRFKLAGYTSLGMGKLYHGGIGGGDPVSWSQPFIYPTVPAVANIGYMAPENVAKVEAFKRENPEVKLRWQNHKLVWPNGLPVTERADVPDNAYHDGAITDEAVRQLGSFASTGEAFFLAVGFRKPHLGFVAPEKYWALYDRSEVPMAEFTQPPKGAPLFALTAWHELRFQYDVPKKGPLPIELQRELVHGYYACVSYIDAQVGRLLDALEANGQLDNTVIVLWGDHGWHLGDHGLWCKHTNYEQSTRSPLIIAAPSVSTPGGVASAPAELADVYPTLIDLAGLDAAGPLDGVSLVPMLEDPTASVKAFATSQFPRGRNNDPVMGYAYRDHRYRLVQWRSMDAWAGDTTGPVIATELYDYEMDPLETRNLADDPAYACTRARLEAYATLSANHHD
ncbi:MAG: sulfatase [Planctomycetota bacterium]